MNNNFMLYNNTIIEVKLIIMFIFKFSKLILYYVFFRFFSNKTKSAKRNSIKSLKKFSNDKMLQKLV